MLCYSFASVGVPLDWVKPSLPMYFGLFTIIIGIYLIYGLFRLKVACPVCLTVHSINLIIFIRQLAIF